MSDKWSLEAAKEGSKKLKKCPKCGSAARKCVYYASGVVEIECQCGCVLVDKCQNWEHLKKE